MPKQLKGKGWFVPNRKNERGEWVQGDTIYVRQGNWRKSTGMKEFGLEILDLTKHNRSELEQRCAVSEFQRLVVPFFKSHTLETIKPMDIEKWQNSMLESYSTSTVRKVKSRLSMIFEKAIDNDLSGRNPVKRSESVPLVSKKREIYTREEVKAILEGSSGWLQTMLYIAFGTGMRTGEMMGLKWSDIDLERGIIHVQRSIRSGRIVTSSKTKNHDRIVVMPETVWKKVAEYHRHRPDGEWVFVSRRGTPWYESSSIVHRHFKPLLKKLGIEYKTLYAARHTYISMMRNADEISKDTVQMTVGHKLGSSVTDDVYNTFDTTRLHKHAEAANNILISVISPTRKEI